MRVKHLFLLSTIGYCLAACSSSPDSAAVDAFEKGDYESAEKLLTEERLRISSPRYTLDKAYILRATNRMNLSTAQFEQAMSLVPARTPIDDPLRQEIYLNLFLNAYLNNDLDLLQKRLDEAEKSFPKDNPWYRLFLGLKSYLEGKYQEANDAWKGLSAPAYLSPWMEASFEKVVPTAWLKQLQSRAAIFSGDYHAIRQKLVAELNNKPDDKEELLFLLALTYVQEGREKSPSAAKPYFKLAFGYLDQIPDIQKKFPQDLFYLNLMVLKQIRVIIASQEFTELPFYIDAIQKWGDQEQLKELARGVTDQISGLIAKERWNELKEISPALNELITDPDTRQQLAKRYEELAQETLKKGENSAAEKLASLARLFSANPEALDQRLAAEVQVQLFAQIRSTKPSFETIQTQLNLWKALVSSPSQRLEMAQKLLILSKNFWSSRGSEQNAIATMHLAASLIPPNRQLEFKASMEKLVDGIYGSAIAQSDFDKLKYILEAQKTFALDPAILSDPKEIANLEADAQLLFKQGNYTQAYLVADWIANLNPQLETTQVLAGQSAYLLGDYTNALKYLRKLPVNPSILEARAVSELVAGDPQAGQRFFAQLDPKQLTPVVYERLAIAEFKKGNLQAALKWTKELAEPGDELKAVQLLIYYRLGNYNDVIRVYRTLQKPYSLLSAINSATALAAIKSGQHAEAEEFIRELYENNWSANKSQETFKTLLQDAELAPSKFYAGGMYYKVITNNPDKAVLQFAQIEKFSPESALEYAETLSQLGRNTEGLDLLKKYKALFEKSNTSATILERYLALDALLRQRLGAMIEAQTAWQKYFAIKKDSIDPESIREYAKVLDSLRLYGNIEALVNKIPAKQQKPEDLVSIVQARIHLGDFKLATQLAEKLIDQPQIDPAILLQLAKSMLITQDSLVYSRALGKLPPQEKLDDNAAAALFDLLVFRGEYDKALRFYRSKNQKWQTRPEVLLSLYDLYDGLSQADNSKKVAQQIGRLDPNNYQYAMFKVQYADDDPFNAAIEKKYRPLFDKGELEPSPSLEYALALQEEALEEYLSGKTPDINQTPSLHMSVRVLVELAQKYPNLAELQYYYGQATYLLGQKDISLRAFKDAIALDKSYADAYLHAGLLLSEDKKYGEAVDMLKNAVQYSPNDGIAWQKYAESAQRLGNYLDAITGFANATIYKPNIVSNFIKLGELQLQLNNPENAIETLDRALALEPDNVNTLQLLLKALYNTNLRSQKTAFPDINAKQKEVYEKLYQLDPKGAVEFKKKLLSNTN